MKRLCRLFVSSLVVLTFSGCPQQTTTPTAPTLQPLPVVDLVAPSPTPTSPAIPLPMPVPTALPEAFVPRRSYDVSKLFNGLKIYSHLQSQPGGIAPTERELDESFSVDISLKVKVPTAMTTVEDFARTNPNITKALPNLADLLMHSRVSPYYHYLYAQKVKSLQQDMRKLEEILSRHNFYDCGTILELTNPTNKRKALWLQGDMDVVTDGSDSDRYLEVDGSSIFYQPFTSYRWPKITSIPSQFLAGRQTEITDAQAELDQPLLAAERAKILRSKIATNKMESADLQTFSFLISKADPFIVLPGFMLRNKSLPFCPRLGDYAVVIFGDKVYPAIFGDVGPSVKIGEASLRLATTLNVKASAANRSTNNLNVSYLVFPQTADEIPAPPNYEKWRTRCQELLTEIGATNLNLEHWDNILPPMATPTPTPDPILVIPAPKPLTTPVSSPVP